MNYFRLIILSRLITTQHTPCSQSVKFTKSTCWATLFLFCWNNDTSIQDFHMMRVIHFPLRLKLFLISISQNIFHVITSNWHVLFLLWDFFSTTISRIYDLFIVGRFLYAKLNEWSRRERVVGLRRPQFHNELSFIELLVWYKKHFLREECRTNWSSL